MRLHDAADDACGPDSVNGRHDADYRLGEFVVQVSAADWKKWNGKGQTLAVFAFKDAKQVELLGLGKEAADLAAAARADGFKANEHETFVLRPARGIPAERL